MLIQTSTLTGDALNWAVALAFGYPTQEYVKTNPDGSTKVWSDGSAQIGVSIDILQNGNIEIFTPNLSSLQSNKVTGQTANNETQRISQLRSYVNKVLGATVDIEPSLLPPEQRV